MIEHVETAEGPQYQVGLREDLLPRLPGGDLAPNAACAIPQNARFIFNDETRQLEVINLP